MFIRKNPQEGICVKEPGYVVALPIQNQGLAPDGSLTANMVFRPVGVQLTKQNGEMCAHHPLFEEWVALGRPGLAPDGTPIEAQRNRNGAGRIHVIGAGEDPNG